MKNKIFINFLLYIFCNIASAQQGFNDKSTVSFTASDLGNANIVHNLIIEKRINNNFRGYEASNNFRLGSKKYLNHLNASTTNPEIKINKEKFDVISTFSGMSYDSHETEFKVFFDNHLKNELSKMDVDLKEAVRLLNIRSALSYEDDISSWKKGWKATYIWPVCRPPDPR